MSVMLIFKGGKTFEKQQQSLVLNLKHRTCILSVKNPAPRRSSLLLGYINKGIP